MANRQHEVVREQERDITDGDALRRLGVRDCLQNQARMIVVEIELWTLTTGQGILNGKIVDLESTRIGLDFT
jgi:hypothetical protein